MPKDKPEIRFAGFTDAWEKRNVTEVAKVSIGLVTTMTAHYTDRGTLLIRNSDIKSGRFDFDENPIYLTSEFADQNQNRKLVLGDVVTVHTGDIGTSAVISHSEDGAIGFATINSRPNGSLLNSEYFATFLNTQGHKNFAFRMATGDGRLNYNLKDFNKLYVPTPTVNEQKQIGTFFKLLDNLIAVNQRKVDLLKELKKGFLQKMFPKNGEDKPEIRFAGYTDVWEKRKLGEIGETHSGIGFPENEQGGKKGIPFFKVSDMNNLGNEHEMNVANNYVNDEQLERRKWKVINNVPGIIFAKVGAAIMLNRKRLIKVPFLMDNNTMEYAFDRSWNVYFGKTLFETLNLPKYAQVGALPSYNGSDIETISVEIPEKDEQERIGTFFQRLDQLITVNQRRVDLLKQEKKALLQKMFV